MFNWLDEFFRILHENRSRKAQLLQLASEKRCESCEILRIQLERANLENDKLLNRLLEKPTQKDDTPPVEVTPPRHIPWAVRRQMLEQEDREKARLMKESVKPDKSDTSVNELEKELGIENG